MLFQTETANLIPGNLARSRLGIHSGAANRSAAEEDCTEDMHIGAGGAPGSPDQNHHRPASDLRRRTPCTAARLCFDAEDFGASEGLTKS